MLKEENLVLRDSCPDGILHGIGVICAAISSCAGTTSAHKVASAQILVLWLGLGVVFAAIKQA